MTQYLDIQPMIHSLRTTPEDFDLRGSWLRHNPSRHCFRFENDGSITIQAACDCKLFLVAPEAARDLAASFEDWRENYWRGEVINREFAAHFHHRSGLRRALIRFTSWLHMHLAQQDDRLYPAATQLAAE